MKKSLAIGVLVAGVFFSGCTASLTQAYSDTVNSINETAREVNAKNEQKRNKSGKIMKSTKDIRPKNCDAGFEYCGYTNLEYDEKTGKMIMYYYY